MSVADQITAERAAAAASPVASEPSRWGKTWQSIEGWLVALTERANPILVKETRQALKSRQFVVTFLIVLVACWVVSFAGVAIIGPQIYYAAAGAEMLSAYFAILAFPLTLIVPYTAYRSLAAEQEENTYDLLSITTLSSRQIVSGKLLSAMVQMLVFLSAVSPCIAFTFLLRGVDALTAAVLIGLAVLACLGLSMFGLLVGAVARARHTQVVISVALVLGLAGAFALVNSAALGVLEEGSSFLRDEEFWVGVVALLIFYVPTIGLLHAAATAQIAFVSENRSSPLRRWMLAQQACFCGAVAAIGYAAVGWQFIGMLFLIAGPFAMAYWYVMGALMTSEWPHLSRRVQRSLPQSQVGRTVLSLFNPGPGAGYLFATANLTALVIVGLSVVAIATAGVTGNMRQVDDANCLLVLGWGYVIAFLGFGRLIINALRRWVYVPMAGGFLVHCVLLLAGIGVPTMIQMSSRQLRNSGYSLVQISNPFWTLGEVIDHGMRSVPADTLLIVVPAVAIIALLLNVRSVGAELMLHRVAVPTRVAEDEAELRPAPAAKPMSPWDDPLSANAADAT